MNDVNEDAENFPELDEMIETNMTELKNMTMNDLLNAAMSGDGALSKVIGQAARRLQSNGDPIVAGFSSAAASSID